jgi:serine/threonine protein kinase
VPSSFPPPDPFDKPTLAHKAATEPDFPRAANRATVQNEARDTLSNGGALRRVFGNYELIEELGRGGMGVVYKARQLGLNRLVALKMILPGPLANQDDLQRFRVEAEAAANLHHPNIVAVHEVGVVEGIHYFSMDLVEGPSLSKRLQQGGITPRLAARYLRVIARAVEHGHTHGILHRDLKPSNILLDLADEPHVTDYGLAKHLDDDAANTRTGAVLGTPSYMSPEQAAGRVKELSPASDVYSLGAMLYELLTGRPPFLAASTHEIIQRVLESDPENPRRLNSRVDRDLETICLKCLEKDPKRRYATAGELADDLDRYLNGEAIKARPFNVLDRLARTLGRSQHASEFRDWEANLFACAGIMFLAHLGLFILVQTKQAESLHWAIRLAQIALLGLVLRGKGDRSFFPRSSAERQLWSIWIGYTLAYLVAVVVLRGLAGPETWDALAIYPFSALLSGLAFFVMGSNFWGKCFLIGLGFFGLACLMPLWLEAAPLALGLWWSVALLALGIHVRRLSRDLEADSVTKLSTSK